MSVMFLSDEFIANIALTLADILNNPHSQRHIYYDAEPLQRVFDSCREGVYKEYSPASIQCILRRLNYNAYCELYPCEAGYVAPEYNAKTAVNLIYECGEVGFLKKYQCFIYQCDEDSNGADPVLKALKSFEKSIMLSIIEKLPEYSRAAWL